jgi:hypothetical protein
MKKDLTELNVGQKAVFDLIPFMDTIHGYSIYKMDGKLLKI